LKVSKRTGITRLGEIGIFFVYVSKSLNPNQARSAKQQSHRKQTQLKVSSQRFR
jgi:hypothetical protein